LFTLVGTGTDQVPEVGELEGCTGSKAGSRSAEQMESDGRRRCSGTAVTIVCQPSRAQVRCNSVAAG